MRHLALALAISCVPLLACKTLSEVSIGYADAVSTSELPAEGPWQQVRVEFPALRDLDPLSSPSLSRYEVGADELERVVVTGVELEGPSGACGLPFTELELQIRAAELGATTLASAKTTGECLTWTLTPDLDLSPWFRQPSVSIEAVVDGEPLAEAVPLSLQVSFLVDIREKRID